MVALDELLADYEESSDKTRAEMADYLIYMLTHGWTPSARERETLNAFTTRQIGTLLREIPEKASFREKDACCSLGDRVMMLLVALYPDRSSIPEEDLERAGELAQVLKDARPIDNTVRLIFEKKPVEAEYAETYVGRLLSYAASDGDEYKKGRMYACLLDERERLTELGGKAGERMTAYLEGELERYSSVTEPDADTLDAMELAADLARFFISPESTAYLHRLILAGHTGVGFYAAETILKTGGTLDAEEIRSLAAERVFANLSYRLLKDHGLASSFPAEYSTPEYLAESDLVHWLTYPTELGRVPDEIEYLGPVRFLLKRETYYVFRFRSDSETLSEEQRGQWLIGWSNEDGGTFSKFEPYADHDRGTVEKTLKEIKRHCI